MNDRLMVQDFGDSDFDGNGKAGTVEADTEASPMRHQTGDLHPDAISAETGLSSPDAPTATAAAQHPESEPRIPTSDDPPEIGKPSLSDLSIVRLIEKADRSAGRLVNLIVKHFPSFRDEARFDGRKVRFLKRAQIFVADIWAAFNGTSYGAFDDVGHLTIFAGR